MKTLYKNIWFFSFALFVIVGFSSCLDEDESIGYQVTGHWFGDMDMYYEYNNGRERAIGTEIEFHRSWSYDKGTGVQIDYYSRHAVTSYFNWHVSNRILYLTFDDPGMDCAIVDYTLTYDYFRGYVADYYSLENLTYFNLRNYDRYWDNYGYAGYSDYYDYYVKPQTRSDAADTVSEDSISGRSIRGIYVKE
ncbi:MAG: hypothetical protein J6W75_07880 [Bacteroidaceae bacterium]|nr:hypothetical protein [Bacteroidaceae bacterium]